MNCIVFIGEFIKGYEIVIDIGSDYGFVLKYVLDYKYIKYVVVFDINKGLFNYIKKI